MTDVSITFKISNELAMMISNYLLIDPTFRNQSELLRYILEDFLKSNDKNFLDKKIKEYNEMIESMKENKKIIELKAKSIIKIPPKELEFLMDASKKLNKNPMYMEGIIESYRNIFKKPYRVSSNDFFKLIIGAEKQCKKRMK